MSVVGKPYDVKIEINTLSDSDWRKVIKRLADQPLYAAKLLAGEMPQDIEPVFTAAGSLLFPARRNDLKTGCSARTTRTRASTSRRSTTSWVRSSTAIRS
jgi:uncharacterized Zn finger protein